VDNVLGSNHRGGSFDGKFGFVPGFFPILHALVQMFLRRKYFQVLARVHNPGVKYEYLLPVSPNSISTSEEENSSDSEKGYPAFGSAKNLFFLLYFQLLLRWTRRC
jgi:hypothetical protein